MIQYKCPGCGADMRYDTQSKMLKCDSCGSEIPVEEAEKAKTGTGNTGESGEPELFRSEDIPDEAEFESIQRVNDTSTFQGSEGKQYICHNCGAQVITTEDTTATQCSFCGASVVLSDRLTGQLAPARIVPFTINREQATMAFRKWCKNGRLTPSDFKVADRIKSLTGMYVPFWLYDMEGEGEADCTATRIRTYTRGDYIYTETKYYHVYRRVHLSYQGIPADASEKMNDTLMDCLEPYNYTDLKKFQMPYLAGYLAEKYDYTDEQLQPRIDNRVTRYASDYLQSTISGYSSVQYHRKNIDIHKVNAHYTLLPVWMVSYNYKDGEHIFAMNGQNGKVVGKPPISREKVAMWFAGISAGVFALLRLVTMLVR